MPLTPQAEFYLREWRVLSVEQRSAVLVLLDGERHRDLKRVDVDVVARARREAFTTAAFLLTLLVDVE